MQKVINRYYKQRISRGRGSLARIIDAIALRAALLFACYVWFRSMGLVTYVSAFLGVIAVGLASIAMKIWRDLKFEKFVVRERKNLAREEARSRLATMREDELSRAVCRILKEDGTINRGYVEVIQRISPVDADDIASVYRAARREGENFASVFSTSGITKDAHELAEKLDGMEFRLYDESDLSERGGVADDVTDDEIDAAIVRKYTARESPVKKLKTSVFASSRVKPYVILGVVLLILSFIANGGMYYRIIASACLSFAVTTAVLDREKR